MSRWLVDGEPGALLSPEDRGLLYGDGLFETVAFHNRESRLWSLHMQRLEHGCRRLDLPFPDPDLLRREALELVGSRDRAVVRLALTRGVGGRAYFPPDRASPTRILIRREWPEALEQRRRSGVVMRTSRVPLGFDAAGGLKHSSRLDQVLIASEIKSRGAEEALVLDREGRIVEGLAGNIVVDRHGELIAPGPHPSAVAGVGLAWLRRRSGHLVERPMRADELTPGDRLWVINSVTGPCPVCSLDDRPIEIEGVVRQWQDAWREEVEK